MNRRLSNNERRVPKIRSAIGNRQSEICGETAFGGSTA
jgi:hypothetical protein